VGDLERDTRVELVAGAEGRWTAKLSADWNIWGPNGGYIASVALRAAGLASGRARPASIVAHFLGVARFETVEIETAVLKASRFATSVRVSVRQDDRPILDAMVWGVDPGGVTLEHDLAPAPDVCARTTCRPSPSGWRRCRPTRRGRRRWRSSRTSTTGRSTGTTSGRRPGR
jgi:acyl-CoA thioesterase II